MIETEWNETWEDARGGIWDVSFCLSETEVVADLDVRGFQAGVGNFVISGSDYIQNDDVSRRIAEENYGFIHEVVVRPPAIRGRGVGSGLVKYIMEWMKDRGCEGCGGILKDNQNNEARERFWSRLGFDLLRNKDGKVRWVKRSFN